MTTTTSRTRWVRALRPLDVTMPLSGRGITLCAGVRGRLLSSYPDGSVLADFSAGGRAYVPVILRAGAFQRL